MGNHKLHVLSAGEIFTIQTELLKWYDKNRRTLPWRIHSEDSKLSEQDRAYSVLVSEIMLQQTQVATVEKYYVKWMKKWPTLSHLSQASLEEVNEMWAGLGYYARGRRLLDLAKVVTNTYEGVIPSTTKELIHLPGIGKYTAGAISSIVFGQKVAAIDGNAIRIISRIFAIGGCWNEASVNKEIWMRGEEIVPERAGHFNQSLMDFANSVCTVKSPSCGICPLNKICRAYNSNNLSIEECNLCLPHNKPWSVENFPQKALKKSPRLETTAVFVVHNSENKYLIVGRNSSGLLANLWEFPSFIIKEDYWNLDPISKKYTKYLNILLKSKDLISQDSYLYLGNITHLFSHIRQTYVVFTFFYDTVKIKKYDKFRWVSENEFKKSAVSTGMKKIFKLFKHATNKSD